MRHIKFLKIAFNLRVTNIYLSIYLFLHVCICIFECMWMCAYVLVYCDEHLQLAQKVIDFGAVQSGNNGNGMEFLGKMNWNGEGRFFNIAKLNRNTQMPYIYTKLYIVYTCIQRARVQYTECVYNTMWWIKWIIRDSAFGMQNHENEWEIIRHVECFGIRWDDDALNYALCTAVYLSNFVSVSLPFSLCVCFHVLYKCMYIWVYEFMLGQHFHHLYSRSRLI